MYIVCNLTPFALYQPPVMLDRRSPTRCIYATYNVPYICRAGTVWVNCYDVLEAQAPFGGYKVGQWSGITSASFKGYTPVIHSKVSL